MKQNRNVFGVALNHRLLREQMEVAFNTKPHVKPPTTPVLFIKPDNTQIESGSAIPTPISNETVYAGPAIAIVIGKKTCRVSAENAADFIEGFTIINEVSLAETSFYRPAIKAKCRDGFCPISANIIKAEKIANPAELAINTFINNELVHTTNTSELHYSFNELIEFVSGFITLEQGDIIIAGTPPQSESLVIKAGDVVAIEIDQLGRLENPVVLEQELS